MVSTTLESAQFDRVTTTLLGSLEDGVVVYDPEFRYVLFNSFMERLSGLRAADVLGKPALDLFPELRAKGIDKLLERALAGETVRSPDLPYTSHNGRSGWLVAQYSPVIATDGARVGVIGIVRDVTHRKQTEEALRRSEGWFRSITENASEMVVVLESDGTTKYASPSMARFFGVGAEELVGRTMFSVIHPDDHGLVLQEFARLVKREGLLLPLEFRCRDRTGEWRVVQANARNLLDEGTVKGVVVHARDVTDQRALEMQLHHAQRLDAVGRLAGGIAHDFNNLLSVIQGNVQLAAEAFRGGRDASEELSEISDAAERAATLTRQLLAFSRQQPLTLEILCPNSVIEGVERLLHRFAGDTSLTLALAPGVGTVRADRGQLEQVLMNLVANARDAMPGGGEARVGTRDATVAPEMARFHPGAEPGEYVVLFVEDTGTGMSSEVRARIFEPFFTTKERGKGTGLGLPTVYGIAKQCGGFVTVDSEVGKGSSFQVYLPRA